MASPKLNSPIPQSDHTALERVQLFIETVCLEPSSQGWESFFRETNLRIISVVETPPSATYELTITPEMANPLGHLHGGATSTIFDDLTTCSIGIVASDEFWPFGGVSRTLLVTYLKPVRVGEVIIVETELLNIGKRLCSLRGVMKRKSDGTIVATAEHGKVDPQRQSKSKI